MRYSTRLGLFIVLINLLVLGVDALSLRASYEQYERMAFAATKNVSDLLVEELHEKFSATDKALLVVADEFDRQSAAARIDPLALDQLLRRHLQRNPMLLSLRITDARGEVLAGFNGSRPPANSGVGEREYFIQQRDNPDAGLVISKPVVGKITGQLGIVFSRRLNHRNGAFAGVVLAHMGLDHIESTFSRLSVGQSGSVTLRDANMALVVRVPRLAGAGALGSRQTSTEFQEAIQRQAQSGTYTSGKTTIDGIPKLHAYGRLPAHPFYVNVGMARADFLAAWQQDLTYKVLYYLVFSVFTVVGGYLLLHAWHRREETLEELRQSEARTRTIVDAALDAVVQMDARGRIVDWNQSAEHMFGWPKALVMGRDLVDTIAVARSQEAHFAAQRRNAANRDPSAIFSSRFEAQARHCDGHEFPVEVSVTSMGVVGRREYSAFIRDITALKAQQASALALQQSQERFRLAMDASQDGLWDWDIDSGGGYFSPTYYKLLGYADNEFPMTARAWLDHIHPDDRAHVVAINQDCVENRVQEFETEFRMLRKDGSYKWILGRGSAVLRDANGRALRLIGTHRDIDSRKVAEDALLAAKAEAETANHAKSRFLAAASHDLRQPLSAMSLYVDVLKSKMAPADEKLVKNMSLCVSSLGTLLTDLLDISKLEAGVVVPVVVDFSVADLLARLVAVHSPSALESGLHLRWRACTCYARTDPVLMERVLGNLLANAIRYTDRGGVLIGCRHHQGKTWIEVWDTGIGIPPDKTQIIFEEYHQLEPNRAGHRSGSIGSGLGLAIVAKSTALMGLRVRVHSRVGHGSMFAVELPMGRRSEATQRDTSVARPLRIGLVDDNSSILDAMGTFLQSRGHQTIAASSAAALLQLLGEQPPDLVISDYQLQDHETGSDVIRAARQVFGETLPALIITGNTAPQFLSHMATQGIAVQHKPLKLEDLLSNIAQLTNRRADPQQA